MSPADKGARGTVPEVQGEYQEPWSHREDELGSSDPELRPPAQVEPCLEAQVQVELLPVTWACHLGLWGSGVEEETEVQDPSEGGQWGAGGTHGQLSSPTAWKASPGSWAHSRCFAVQWE